MKNNWRFFRWNLNKVDVREENGFTLLEVLVALSVSSLCFILLSSGIKQAERINQEMKQDPQIEWHIFLNQLEFYLKESELVSFDEQTLVVREKNEDNIYAQFTYEKYESRDKNDQMIRRRGTGGHQPVLTGVKEYTFSLNNQQLIIEAQFQTGEKYRAQLFIHSWEEEDK